MSIFRRRHRGTSALEAAAPVYATAYAAEFERSNSEQDARRSAEKAVHHFFGVVEDAIEEPGI